MRVRREVRFLIDMVVHILAIKNGISTLNITISRVLSWVDRFEISRFLQITAIDNVIIKKNQ